MEDPQLRTQIAYQGHFNLSGFKFVPPSGRSSPSSFSWEIDFPMRTSCGLPLNNFSRECGNGLRISVTTGQDAGLHPERLPASFLCCNFYKNSLRFCYFGDKGKNWGLVSGWKGIMKINVTLGMTGIHNRK